MNKYIGLDVSQDITYNLYNPDEAPTTGLDDNLEGYEEEDLKQVA